VRVASAFLTAALLGLVGCGPAAGPVSTTPFNTCAGCTGTAIACEATESGDACLAAPPTLPDYVLVVNVPGGSFYASGEVFTLTPNQVHSAASSPGGCMKGNAPSDSTCIQLPQLYDQTGVYVVNGDFSTLLGNPTAVATTVPVLTSYIPVWSLGPPCAQPCAIEASLLNLPLPTIFASPLTPVNGLSGAAGPQGNLTTGWTAFVPALSSGYVQRVDFASPFNTAFPPSVQPPSEQLGQVAMPPDLITAEVPLLSPPISATGDSSIIAISPGEALTGWSVFLRDRTTRSIVSSQPTVRDGGVSLHWLASGVLAGLSTMNNGRYDIVLSPPPGAVGLPEFADQYFGVPTEAYPSLPKPVTIHGTVHSDTRPVSGNVHFVSTALYYLADSACTVTKADATLLHYDVVVATADRLDPPGAVGQYSVVLPPGQYTITVDPDPVSGFAKTQIKPVADASSGITTLPKADATTEDCTATEDTFDISLEPQLHVTGTVLIADGRALANATVDLTPAASLLASLPLPVAQVDGPRPFEVTTAADGSFSASVDPGMYDVTVRPVDGTRFPWIVSPAHTFSKSNTKLDRLFIPAPVPLSLTLHDPLADLPIAQAVVSAYAFTSCSPAPCNGVALQIGQGFTDGNGSFQMFLTPVPFTPETR
jgi:hypothetical protein